jgi:hypothetical protein
MADDLQTAIKRLEHAYPPVLGPERIYSAIEAIKIAMIIPGYTEAQQRAVLREACENAHIAFRIRMGWTAIPVPATTDDF